MAMVIRCDTHTGYNGKKEPGMPCEGCQVVRLVFRMAHTSSHLETIEPIKLVREPHLGLATTREMLEEIKIRLQLDDRLDYRTVDGGL